MNIGNLKSYVIVILIFSFLFFGFESNVSAEMTSGNYSIQGGALANDFFSLQSATSSNYTLYYSYGKFYQLPACNDGADNDSDGLTDYPNDTGCDSYSDDDESEPAAPAPSGGGGGGGITPVEVTYGADVSILINEGALTTKSRLVQVKLDGGGLAEYYMLSNTENFSQSTRQEIASSSDWFLTDEEGEKTVYAKFINDIGTESDVVTDTIDYSLFQLEEEGEFADIDSDGDIDIFDFNLLMVNWGKEECSVSADLDDNCVVNLFDFNFLMVYWTG